MISDLSPGDRLSLKGKLFELQKKLNIIDIERKMEEQCSFQPKILEYDLPNRKKDFIENSDKADIMRKQKKKMLEQSLALQSEESCTFTPKIYKSRHAVNLDNRPVHVRLSEKAKVYNDAMEKRKVQFSTYDDDGNRLFVPRINSQKPAYLSKNVDDSVVSQPSSNISADEFLYQDAKDREVRHQSRIISYQQEIAKDVNAHKMNSSSKKMLRKKMEKYATEIFLAMDDNHDNIIDYNNVVNYIEHCEISKNSEEQANNNQLFWSIIDQYQGGEVMKRDFIVICTAFLLNKTVHTISQLIKKYEHKKPDNPYRSPDNDHHHSIAPHIQQLKEKDITKFREILTSIIQKLHHGEKFDQSILQSSFLHPTGYAGSVINNEPSEDGGDSFNGDSSSNLFKPKISSYSYKLAEKKEKKDMQLLAELMPTLKYGHDAAINRSKSSVSVDMSQLTLEDLDTSHAGPLPEGGEDPELQRSPLGKTTTGHSPMNKSSSMMSTSGLTISGNSFTSKHERLLAQALLIQKRKEKLAEEVRKKENAECTFRPDRKTKNYQPGIKNLPNATNNLEQEQHEEEEGKEEEGDDDNDVAEVDQRLRENYEVDGVEEEHQEEIINEDIAEGHIELDLREGEEEGEKEVSDLSGELFENEQQQAIEHIDLTNDLTESNEKQPLQIKKQTSFAPTKPTQSLADNKTNDTNEKKKVKKAKNQNKEAESTTNNTSNNDNTDSNNNNPSEPSIYERLYSLKDKKPKAFTEIQPSYVQELQSCTFQPKIPKHHTDLTLIKRKMQNIHQSGIEKNYIEGFNKTVNRMRKTIQEKERIKQEESDEYLHKIAEEKYMKSRELARQGFQPFQFHLEERIHKQQQQQQQQRQNQSNDPNEEHRPDLIVDVKLSSNRSARIRVQHGDDPAELAIRFAKIYSLDKDATTVLETVLKESMIQRGILPDPRKAAANRSNSLSRTRQGSFGSGSEDRSSSNGHRRHRRRRHMSRRFSSRDSRDSIMLSGEEMADAIDDAIMNDGEYSRQPSHRPHRIDTEHSELLGDTSVIVVDEEYSSYTESSEEESESEFSEYEPPNQQALDATTSYLQKHGSHKTSYRDRTSILSELL